MEVQSSFDGGRLGLLGPGVIPVVVAQTGIVLGVVALFMVVITVMDFGLGQLLSLLTSIKG